MPTTLLLDKEEMTRILERLACEVLDRHGQCERVMLVGIERRGADLARRLGALMQQKLQRPLPLGTLDINLYRDDWTSLEGKPHIGQSRITAPVDNAEIILIDDVLFSGRTIRAALEALLDYGRPARWSCWCSWTAATANCPSRPTTSAAAWTPARRSRWTCCWKNGTDGTKSC